MLGVREPSVYGTASLSDIVSDLQSQATKLNVNLSHFQSNAEHELINAIQQSLGQQDYILINPGSYTHTSVAMRDAFLAVAIPFIEIHLSNVHAREAFRRHSYLADIAKGVICGLGAKGYHYALDAAVAALHTTK
jgi:3-dehydroquinate dehydratase-2